MTWFASLAIAVVTGLLGLVCATVVGAACKEWYHLNSFQRGDEYFVFAVAFYGAIATSIIGLITSRFVGSGTAPGFFQAMGCAAGIVLGISGISTAVCWALADIPPKINGQELELQIELRLPVGETNSPALAVGETYLRLGSVVGHVQRKSERGELSLGEARLEDNRWILPGKVFLFTMRGHRSVDFTVGGKSRGGFIISLPARPGKKFENWSTWFPNPRPGQPPWPDTKDSFRFRVQCITPPPPPPDPEVVKAEKFAALKADAPLSDWLTFMGGHATEERILAVMKVVERRPEDLAQLIRSPESAVREPALAAVAWLKQIPPVIVETVQDEGRNVAADLRRFNEMPSDAPNFLDAQVQLRSRFSYWHHAWWRVHQLNKLDGRPLVQEILDLASVRAKDTSMDEIVINARAHLDGINSTPVKTP